jgi:DNA-3-methyladenine glycosylase I
MEKRCTWASNLPDYYTHYHDTEWGVPVTNDQKLFEFLILEGSQAGLSWSTILKRRENYRKAFSDFNALEVANFSERKIQELLSDSGIIRNKLKIGAAITNAKVFLELQSKHGSFARFIWNYVDGKPIQNKFTSIKEIPAETPLSQKISKELKKLGMKFVGPTIIYAHMQATGMVNDHELSCFRYEEVKALGKSINF